MSSRRAEQKAATREALKDAAHAVFSERGFADAQIADIAKRAGVAHGTFYVHFASKEEVLDELEREFHERLLAALGHAFTPGEPPANVVRVLAETCLDAWQVERGLVLAFAQRAGLEGGLTALRQGIHPPLVRFVADHLRQAGARASDAELIAHGLLGLWTRVGLQALFGEVPRAAAVRVLVQMSVGAVAGVLGA